MYKVTLGHFKSTPDIEYAVMEQLRSGKPGHSQKIEEFEEALAKWFGVKHAVALNSGTTADIIALAILKELYPDRTEVICPSCTYEAQINAVKWNGLTPVIVPNTTEGFNVTDICNAINQRTLCIFPVHLMGYFDNSVLWHYEVPVIEDTCEAFGTRRTDQYAGTFGVMGTLSFFPSHTLSIGEGGAILTNNSACAIIAKSIRDNGRLIPGIYQHVRLGLNGKMTSIQAVIGLEQLKIVAREIRARSLPNGTVKHADLHKVTSPEVAVKALQSAGIEARILFKDRANNIKDIVMTPCHSGVTANDKMQIAEVINAIS